MSVSVSVCLLQRPMTTGNKVRFQAASFLVSVMQMSPFNCGQSPGCFGACQPDGDCVRLMQQQCC